MIGLSKDLLATPLFPCIIVFDLVFGILLIFAGIILVVNPVDDFIYDLGLLDTHLLHLLLFGGAFVLLFLSLDVVLFLVLLLSGLLTSLVGLFISRDHQLILGPLSDDKTGLLLLGGPSGSLLLFSSQSAFPLLVDLLVQIRAQFVIDGFVGEDSLDECFEDVDEVDLAFGMIVDLDFEVSE